MKEFNPKFALLAASTMLAMAFTLSCSNDDDENGSGSGGSYNASYQIVSIGQDSMNPEINSIVYERTSEEYYSCTPQGLKTNPAETWESEIYYSIDNKVLTAYRYEEELASKFNGSSNEIIGTWTRTKDLNSTCEDVSEYGYSYRDCDGLSDVTKMVITDKTIVITREFCITDEMVDGSKDEGYTLKVTGCNSYEMRKGSDVVSITLKWKDLTKEEYTMEATYNGKTCKQTRTEPTKAEQEKACKEANETGEDYWDIIEGKSDAEFEKCIKDKGFPEDLQDSDEDDSYEKLTSSALNAKTAKIAAKSKTSPR